jgi:hypothetical protein
MKVRVDPVSRRFEISYDVPADAPDVVTVRCSWSAAGTDRWERLRVWVEGVPMGEVDLYLDDQLINRYAGPPYILGGEEHSYDKVIPPGPHTLRVRARDGDGWLEQTFDIRGAGKVKPPKNPRQAPAG